MLDTQHCLNKQRSIWIQLFNIIVILAMRQLAFHEPNAWRLMVKLAGKRLKNVRVSKIKFFVQGTGQTSLVNLGLAVNLPIQLTVGMLENATRLAVELHIIAAKVTSLLESKQPIVKLTAHGRPKSFRHVFVSTSVDHSICFTK